MALTLANADAALKEDYQPAMREQLNNSVMLLQQIERNSKDVEGRRAVLSLHVRRNSGIGARGEGGTLPTAGQQKYAEERVGLRYNYGRINITGPTIRAMRSDAGSFVRAIDSETKGAVTDLRRDVNRQLFGTSDGVFTKVGAASAATLIPWHTSTTSVQKRQVEVGMFIDCGTATPFTGKFTAIEVTGVDTTNGITVISAVTCANGDSIARSGSGGSGSAQKELTGLQTIIAASGALFNVDPSTEPVWAAPVLSNSGTLRAASETLFAQALMQGSIVSGTEVKLFITSDGVHRNFAAQQVGLKRFANTLDLKGGYQAISITAGSGEKGLIWDRDCPSNSAFGVSPEHLVQHEMSDWEWMDEDGAVLSRISGQDAYEAVLFKYHELTTDQRNSHLLISDLQES